jgi:outer membrane lipoprotein-sorting protein
MKYLYTIWVKAGNVFTWEEYNADEHTISMIGILTLYRDGEMYMVYAPQYWCKFTRRLQVSDT